MTRAFYCLATVLMVSAGVAGCDSGKDNGSSGQSCTYNGKTYPYGSVWPSTDGCHQCWCDGQPNAVCDAGPPCDAGWWTVDSGQADGSSGQTCTYNGKTYPIGLTFTAIDGCNACWCDGSPNAVCSSSVCDGGAQPVDVGPPDGTQGQTCTYDGQLHPFGLTFMASDGCNECWCIGPTSAMCSGVVCDAGLRSADSGQTDGSAGQSCTYNGQTYPYGSVWPSTDGCHECWCDGRPNAVCDTGPPCDSGVQVDWPCGYDGKSYPIGAIFPSTDGCNTCECLWRWYHQVACTLNPCSGSPVADASAGDAAADACVYNGKTYPLDAHFVAVDGCNECHCRTDGQVTCTFNCRSDGSAAR